MLNEIYTLGRSLKEFHADVQESHPWVKRLGKADIFIASVDTTGMVTGVERVGDQDAVKLFKVQESNHSNFPQVNWTAPLWQLDHESVETKEWWACPVKDTKRRVELLRHACRSAQVSEGQSRTLSRMREFCRELSTRFQTEGESDFAAFPVLMDRLLGLTASAEEWLRGLSEAVLDSVAGGGAETLAVAETLLAGKFDKKTAQFREAKIPILFDLADCTKFRCRVASPRMGGYFSRRLIASEVVSGGLGRCALAGIDMPLEADKMPSPRLPVLGDTVLMSMNPDTPCQTRYGRTGSDIFPLGRRTASELNTALLHLTTADREGKNWKRVPGTGGKKFNLLIVYLESSPLLAADIAEVFSGPDGESDRLYATLCAEVCEALRGRTARDSELLRILVLNKIDPGRVQVELSEAVTAEQVIRGGEEWAGGARNRAPVALKGDDYIPSPTDAMRCLQMMWERGGASFAEAPGCRLADIYDILIAERPGAGAAARAVLRLTLRRATDLLLAVGQAAHRGGKEGWKKIPREAGRNPVIAVSLLGIALSKLGHRKESYMQEPAFLVGRFLSLVDTLHAEYCKDVRKNEMPPQLLGNALIPTAISDPNKGLARMLLRIRVYQAWARGRKGSGLARWSCGEMGKISNDLAEKLPRRRFNEEEQAQLLLGYLARAEKSVEEGVQQ